jgi:hypothetical protein
MEDGWLRMLKIQINKNASLQLQVAAAYIDVLPNRIASAQQAAALSAQKKLPNRIATVAKAAKYLNVSVERYGPVGINIVIGPSKNRGSKGKHGYNKQIASAIVLTGRKSHGTIRAKGDGMMKTRPESVSEGYNRYYKEVRSRAIPSKKTQIRQIARTIVAAELSAAFTRQGFGTRGGVKNRSDIGPIGGR